MRPEILNPLFAPVTALPGIGSRLAKRLTDLLLRSDTNFATARIADLLWHLPVGVIDRSFQPKIVQLSDGVLATLAVLIDRHEPPPSRHARRPYRVFVHDDTGAMTLVFFHARADYLRRIMPEGEKRYVSGTVTFYDDQPRMLHPDYILDEDEFQAMPLNQPVYPMTAGLSPKTLLKVVGESLERCPIFDEWQDLAWRDKNNWADFTTALKACHAPTGMDDLGPDSPLRARLAYDELLANQLALGLIRAHLHKSSGRAILGTGEIARKIIAVLPFSLTSSQSTTVEEIKADMAAPSRMLRLLQGDVGSGKTIVAVLAMAVAVEAGMQGVFMAPTELLARQHLATLIPWCAAAGVKCALLTGREKGAVRRLLLADLVAGNIQILIGTHALFQEGVEFDDLGLVVIDEQHRFGVHQRLAIQAKGMGGVDVLVMTATPIPRTLTLTHYGDMDVSRLTEKPPGRQPIDTRVLPADRIGDVTAGLARAIADGARVYWICPLIELSEELDLVSALDRHKVLSDLFPGRTGLIHGRMKGLEKDKVMARFQMGDIDILVATTVVEVGVDVPEATVMIIEHAERFGLAQLHQLRGRIGRSARRSTCVLVYKPPLSGPAEARLKAIREIEDGFEIAEEDLRLRGGGELLGTRQSGAPEFKLASLECHDALLATAHDDARLILASDPLLASERGKALKILLYLFERDEAVRLISAG